MIVYVYILTSPENKSYIGISKDPERRFNNHCRANSLIGRKLRKFGPENFAFEIVDSAKSWEEAYELEKGYIIEYNTFLLPNGYNLASGGEGGDTISNHPLGANRGEKNASQRPGVRKKISMTKRGKKRSKESIEKQLKTLEEKGEEGRKHGPMKEETKEILRQINLGKEPSEETIKKRSETRKKRGTDTSGEKNPMSRPEVVQKAKTTKRINKAIRELGKLDCGCFPLV